MSRFLYFYLMRDEPDAIRDLLPAHVQYWRSCDLPEYVGGPFGDRTGGLITFAAHSLERARRTVLRDPFVQANLVQDTWVKEWRVE